MQADDHSTRPTVRRATAVAFAALLLAVLSLLANLYLVDQLRRAERAVAPFRPLIEEAMGPDGTLRSEVTIPAGTPVELDVPVDERVSIRIDTVLPIRTRITVPIRSPVGNWDVPVPIAADVPLRMVLPLHLRHTFELRTTTAEPIVIPIELN